MRLRDSVVGIVLIFLVSPFIVLFGAGYVLLRAMGFYKDKDDGYY